MTKQGRKKIIEICNVTGRDTAKTPREIIKEDVTSSFLNLEDDGIERIKDESTDENGYLVVKPTQEEGNAKHLALKVDNNKFWTISAINGGSELEIGIIENGEHRKVIGFNETAALELNEVLNLGAGLSAIEQPGKPKGIPTSGFKGFKEGKLYATGNWESTGVKIPENSFGKYGLQAWLIQPNQDRYSHLETSFIFFPEKPPVKRVKHQSVNHSQLGIWYQKIKIWWLKHILKREIDIKAGSWIGRLDAKVDKNEIKIRCEGTVDRKRKIIYYSIERLWEGENWIEDDSQQEEPQ